MVFTNSTSKSHAYSAHTFLPRELSCHAPWLLAPPQSASAEDTKTDVYLSRRIKLAATAASVATRAGYTMRRLLAKKFRLSVLACCVNDVLERENMHSGTDGFCSAEPEAFVKLRMIWWVWNRIY